MKGVLYMKKRIEAFLLVCVMALAMLPAALAWEAPVGAVRCARHSTSAQRRTLNRKRSPPSPRDDLALMEYGEDWCRVRIGESGYMGYAKRKWLTSVVIYPSASEAVAASLAATPAPEAADVTLTELTPEAALAESTPEATTEPTPEAIVMAESAPITTLVPPVSEPTAEAVTQPMQTMIPVNVSTSTDLATGSDLNVSTATDMLGDMPFFTGRTAAEEDFAMQGWAVLQGSLRVMDETGMGNTLRAGDTCL